jgi:hypothetical protein
MGGSSLRNSSSWRILVREVAVREKRFYEAILRVITSAFIALPIIVFTQATETPGPDQAPAAFSTASLVPSASVPVIDAVDKLRKGDSLRLYDIEAEKIAFETPAPVDELGDDPFPPELRRILSIAADSEKRFGVRAMFADQITEEDTASLFYLNCLLNGRQYGTNLSLTMNLTKQGLETASAHALFLSGQPVSLFLGPSNYPDFFPLFGTKVPAPAWGLYTEQCVVEDGETARVKYDHTPVGEKVHFTVVAKTATFVRWRADSETLLGIAPNGDMKQGDSPKE